VVDILQQFEKDAGAEEEGRWFTITDGLEFLIARANNPRHVRVMERISRQHKADLSTGTLPQDTLIAVTEECYAEAIWLDWKGELVYDGETVTNSKEMRLKMLRDRRLRDMKEAIYVVASNGDAFVKEEQEASAKNSSRSSSGKKSTAS